MMQYIPTATAMTNQNVPLQQQQQHQYSTLAISIPTPPPPPTQPTYVNAKQYRRIMHRRMERNVLEEFYERHRQHRKRSEGTLVNGTNHDDDQTMNVAHKANGINNSSSNNHPTTYQYESRSRHAKKRPRVGGRFLSGNELEQYYKDHPDQDFRKKPPPPPPNNNNNNNKKNDDDVNNDHRNDKDGDQTKDNGNH